MILEADIKKELEEYLKLMESEIEIKASIGSDKVSQDMLAFLGEIAELTTKIKVKQEALARTPSFSINSSGEAQGITFAGIPLGHELNSFLLAVLQVSGRAPKCEQSLIDSIKNIDQEYNFETYVSLNCNNCPDVVQALNLMSIINPKISHTMIDGGVFKAEVDNKNILAVPAIYLNGDFFKSGRLSLEKILKELGIDKDNSKLNNKDPFDVLIVGGGPAAVSAGIYAARKGIKTGIVADRLGGQVLDTSDIENFISQTNIEGSKLVQKYKEHIEDYNIDLILSQRAKKITKNDLIEVDLESGASLKSKSVIIASGAGWKKLNIAGEKEFKNNGVAYCPHCDGPMYEGKKVAVIGGGNSGIEAAIDLAGIADEVTVLEFLPELKADQVLQDRISKLDNVDIITNAQTKEIKGSDSVEALSYLERDIEHEKTLYLDGVFVQIGLTPNTDWLEETLELNKYGEIIVDNDNSTSLEGVFAAGDCTDNPYKQIVISMGSGANAALGAFDYLIRN